MMIVFKRIMLIFAIFFTILAFIKEVKHKKEDARYYLLVSLWFYVWVWITIFLEMKEG